MDEIGNFSLPKSGVENGTQWRGCLNKLGHLAFLFSRGRETIRFKCGSILDHPEPFACDRPFPLVLDQNIGRAWNAKVFLKATFGKWQFSMPLSRIKQKKRQLRSRWWILLKSHEQRWRKYAKSDVNNRISGVKTRKELMDEIGNFSLPKSGVENGTQWRGCLNKLGHLAFQEWHSYPK